ncbi:SDR family NAD(P)-dependent oxidoreductase [Mucilaginibacter aquariorum]|uniref:SDR family oxidoreductase n=1 Tax=Mucilaginibacter aquariorum TaxID=2967225 RepID=A0ABT1SX36_9SPHI|nr:SDR family oxidoreductase [Mucilaginibacter aquariorum]MCQ6956913.1 SDR family oxidoreductase [Mucilaginibacter aquariorum]
MSNTTKYALITGATSGIGLELVKLFAKDNYNLIIVSRNQQELDKTAKELQQNGVDVITIAKDLFNRDEVFSLCEEVKRTGIQVDVLVNDAGQGVYGLFKDNDIDRELKIIDLNIGALTILTKHFLKEMVSRNEGKILNVASIASETPGPWQAVYHATKAYVLSLTEAIREEVKDTNITITALQPGVTDTDFFNKAGMNDSKAVQDKEAMANAANVAKDGYDALMAGKDKIVSGFKNKLQMAMGNVTPDSTLAHMVNEQQKPVEH